LIHFCYLRPGTRFWLHLCAEISSFSPSHFSLRFDALLSRRFAVRFFWGRRHLPFGIGLNNLSRRGGFGISIFSPQRHETFLLLGGDLPPLTLLCFHRAGGVSLVECTLSSDEIPPPHLSLEKEGRWKASCFFAFPAAFYELGLFCFLCRELFCALSIP